MSYPKKKHILLEFFVIWLVLLCWISSGMTAENSGEEEQTVSYEAVGDISLGYRWISTEDSLKAAEYIYPHSSLVLGVDLLAGPLPYRYHLNGELASKHDFYLDGGFAYKDMVLFRNILVGVHHNLNHYDYSLSGESGLVYDDRDLGAKYYNDFVNNLLSLRLKAPDYPMHVFVRHRHVEKVGTIQQRFLLGYFDALTKVSESRDIDWKSDTIKLGANSHLGPLEVEYAYDQTKFDPGSKNILSDEYNYPISDPPRPDGTYPHNVVPETEARAHSIKLHTSYTGSIVAAATISNLLQKNNYSRTESTTWKEAFDFSWIPAPAIALFLRYRHIDLDMDTPDLIPAVRPGISYGRDEFFLSSRYKPMRRLTLNANYKFTHIERRDVEEWQALSDQTNIHKVNLKANARPIDNLKVTARYEYKYYDNPSYNTTPDKSNMLQLATTYTPIPAINIYLQYILAVTKRDSLIYLFDHLPAPKAEEEGERDGQRDQFLASLGAQISPKTSITCSWFYQRWEIDQDLAYGKWLDPDVGTWPFIDPGVPYTDESNTLTLSLHYIPWDDLSITADLSHTVAEGTTGYHDLVEGVQFPFLSTYSDLKVTETSFFLNITKKFYKNWEVGFRSYFGIFDDKTSDFLDGKVVTSTLELKRYF